MSKFLFNAGGEPGATGGGNEASDFSLTLADGRVITAADIKEAKLKAAGSDRTLAGDDLKRYASLGFGSETRFREAAELAKNAEQSQKELAALKQRLAIVEAAKTGDPAAIRKFAEEYGLLDQLEHLGATEEVEDLPVRQQPRQRQAVAPAPELQIPSDLLELAALQKELKTQGTSLRDILADLRKTQITSTLGKVKQELQSAIDNDDILSIINGEDGGATLEDAWDRLQRRVASGENRAAAQKAVIAEMTRHARAVESALTKNSPRPSMFGAAPTAAGGSRLTPPKAPDPNDAKYKGQTDNVAFYHDLLAHQDFLAQQGSA